MDTNPGPATAASRPSWLARALALVGETVHRWLALAVWILSMAAASTVLGGLRGASALEIAEAIGWVVGVMTIATIGALVLAGSRGLVQGWLLVTFSLLWSVGLYAHQLIGLPQAGTAYALELSRRLIAVGDVAYTLGVNALLLLLLVPDGRLPSPRWKPMLWVLAGSAAFFTWESLLIAHKVVDIEAWMARSSWISNDGATTGPIDNLIFAVGGIFGLVILGLLARALWGRLRASAGEERRQLMWVFFASGGLVGWLLVSLPQADGGWLAAVQRLFPGGALVVFAAGFGMALFRHRLWNIDIVLRRSLVFGLLWLVIALVYVGVAAGLGLAAGARFPTGVAIGLTVTATLVFQPARRWLEQVADRRVFGKRDSPVDAIHSLGEGVANSRRPQDIASELARAATSAVGLAWVSVEIEGFTGAESGTVNHEPETIIPLAWGEEGYGWLRCQPHRGENITNVDVVLLEAMVGQAALAMSHARLASRIVQAQEQERRRIERNIHDGAQQDLATLVAQIGLARARANGDPTVIATLNRIQNDAQRILVNIRELAQGIHPPVLRDGGLIAAIEDCCSRLPMEVRFHMGDGLTDRRLPPETEAAAYFFTAEATTNTLKHSGSLTVDVTLGLEGGRLNIEVRDAGIGFDTKCVQGGSGLAGLSDRMRALGGELNIVSQPGQGTLVTAQLPVPALSQGPS